MLWSDCAVLYDLVPRYVTEPAKPWWYFSRFSLRVVPHSASFIKNQNVCTVFLDTSVLLPKRGAVLWQHVFLQSFMKDMTAGWHLCLLPRHMVCVFKDGLPICDRLLAVGDKNVIDSTQKYLYRFGYEMGDALTTHDFTQQSEYFDSKDTVGIACVFRTQNAMQFAVETFVQFCRMYVPDNAFLIFVSLLFTTTIGWGFAEFTNRDYDRAQINLLREWPVFEKNKKKIEKSFNSIGLLIEARVPKNLFERVSYTGGKLSLVLSKSFATRKHQQTLQKFFEKYDPTQSIRLINQDWLVIG